MSEQALKQEYSRIESLIERLSTENAKYKALLRKRALHIHEVIPFLSQTIINIDPMPAPRINGKSGRFTKTAKRYYAWCDEFRRLVKESGLSINFQRLYVSFVIPFPPSYYQNKSKIKRLLGQPHTLQNKDIDNLCKAVLDALFGKHGTGQGDGHIHTIGYASKVWGEKGQIIFYEGEI